LRTSSTKKRRDARRLVRRAARDNRLLLGGVGLRLRDVALVGHALQHDACAACVARFMSTNGLWRSGIWKIPAMSAASGSESCLLDLSIQPRCGLDAVRAVARYIWLQ